jgi:hypothetical protein
MKTLTILLLFPLKLIAQDITGIWTGFIQTTGTSLPYELVISENKDKLTGYSLTVFIFDGIENIGVKSVKLKNKNGTISIEDNELVYNNYTTPPKRVQLLGRLALKINDSVATLNGSFTTRSLDFREQENNPFTGTIHLQKQNNFAKTKLIAKLDELQLLNTISFIQPKINENEEMARVIPISENVKSSLEKNIQKETTLVPQIIKDTLSVVEPNAKNNETAKTVPSGNNKPILPDGNVKDTGAKTINQPTLNEVKQKTDDLNMANLPKEQINTPQSREKETTLVKPKEQPSRVEQKPKINETAIANLPKEQIKSAQSKEKETVLLKPKEQPSLAEQKPKKDETAIVNLPKEQIKAPQSKEKETISAPVKAKEQPSLAEQKSKKDETAIVNLPKEQIKAPQSKEKETTPVKEKEQPAFVEQKPKESVTIQSSTTGIKPALSSQKPVIAAADVDSRKTEIIRTVFYKSDSLVASLYDNGEIDGDIVSVVLNGRVIIAQNELNASPIKIVIHITPELGDSLHFIMYAENLGRIPPNTGLLIIQDGDERHEIRFAGDLQKNSGIILKRRR